MTRFLRILPLTIIVAVLFLGVKVLEVTQVAENLFVSRVSAQQKDPGEKPPAPEETAAAETPKEEAEAAEGKEKEEKKNPAVSEQPGSTTDRHFSEAELDLLRNLSRRRDDLERWERNVQVKEAALDATEKRIDEKIQQIENMRKTVSDLLAQYNEQEEAKLKSLVKIYENMKPNDAARIFDEIEMPILLLVVDKMAEKKAAPILARMDSKKAKQVTVELAEQRRISTARLNAGVNRLE